MKNIKGLWVKIMENSQQFLDNLKVYLENINSQNISNAQKQDVATQPQGDAIGNLINNIDAQDEMDNVFNNANSVAKPTVPSTPKTVEGSLSTVPVVSTPTVAAPPSAETTVTRPSYTPTNVAPVKPFTGNITPDVISKYTKQFGVPDAKVSEAILRAAKDSGTDANLLFKFAKAESNYKPAVKSSKSSATGLFQFLDSTWDYVMHDLGGKENFKLKGNRKDAYENAMAGAIYLNEIKRGLAPARKSGEFTDGELYLGHFAGPGTAKKAIQLLDSGKGNVSPTQVFSKSQINANIPIFYPVKYKKNSKGQSYGPPIIDGPMRSLSGAVDVLSKKVS